MRRDALALILVTGCVAGCHGRLAPVALPPTTGPCGWPPEYHAGEQLEFHISWHKIRLARLTLLAGPPGDVDGVRAALFQMEVDSAGLVAFAKELHDEMTSVVDVDRGVPLANNGTFEALFRGWGGVRGHAAPIVPWTLVAEGVPVQDVVSGMMLLRAWPQDRSNGHFYIGLGYATFRIDVATAGVETVDCLGEQAPALRLEGLVHDPKRLYRFTTWITTDARHIPCSVLSETTSVGTVRMDLTQWAPASDRP